MSGVSATVDPLCCGHGCGPAPISVSAQGHIVLHLDRKQQNIPVSPTQMSPMLKACFWCCPFLYWPYMWPLHRYFLRRFLPYQERTTLILPQTGRHDLWKTTERARGQNPRGIRWDTDNKAGRSVFFLWLLLSRIYYTYGITQATHVFLSTEQYDAFVKFTHDQLMRRFGEQPASCEYLKLCAKVSGFCFAKILLFVFPPKYTNWSRTNLRDNI